MKKLSKYLKAYLIRPIVQRVFVYLIVTALAVGLWDRFVNTAGFFNARTRVTPFIGMVFVAVAWFRFMRMDAARTRGRRRLRKIPKKTRGGMLDHVDTDPETDVELEEDERDVCVLVSALFCAVVCFVAAVL